MHVAYKPLLGVPLFWYPISFIHEMGHWASAKFIGNAQPNIIWHYGVFSETQRDGSNSPIFDVWMGPVFGIVIPIVLWLMLRNTKIGWVTCWFAAISCLGNALYIGLGWLDEAGDPVDMIKLGINLWVLILFGSVFTIIGSILLSKSHANQTLHQSP